MLIALLITFSMTCTATFAWYIYNTSAHTTKLHMAAGSSVSLKISNEYDGVYSSSTVLASFTGVLDPVSTDRITGGFQKVLGFVKDDNSSKFLAKIFGNATAERDYYKTSLYIKSSGADVGLYISNLGFEDSNEERPISTAIRIGFVVHEQGYDKAVLSEYIFSINDKSNPGKHYNTFSGAEGSVLDSKKIDGSTVVFKPYTSKNYCKFDSSTGTISITEDSLKLIDIKGTDTDEPVQIDVYIWLEGCDEDCTSTLLGQTLKNIALSFSGYHE